MSGSTGLYGMTGLGSNGLGVGGTSGAPNISPSLLAMLMGGAQGKMGTGVPMQAAAPQTAGMPQQPGGTFTGHAMLRQLLAALAGAQSGLAPPGTQGQRQIPPGGQIPGGSGGNPLLAALAAHYGAPISGMGGMPPGGAPQGAPGQANPWLMQYLARQFAPGPNMGGAARG